jgi:YfiH family protein
VTDLPAPFVWEGDDIAADLGGGRVLFTTRRGAPLDRDTNRERIARFDGVPDRLQWSVQVHGTTVLRDAPSGTEADGHVITGPGTAGLVFTADCLPIALAADNAVAMLHGGWRGVAGGIVPAGINVLRDAGASGPIVAALGPSARGCCYEVGEEVQEQFAGYDARRSERNLALEAVVTAQLAEAGVETVHDVGLCTMCTDLFFSHRRDNGNTGRQGNLVWLV